MATNATTAPISRSAGACGTPSIFLPTASFAERRLRCLRIQISSSLTSGADRVWRTASRSAAGLPMMLRSIAKMRSMRCTASSASGEEPSGAERAADDLHLATEGRHGYLRRHNHRGKPATLWNPAKQLLAPAIDLRRIQCMTPRCDQN